MLVGGTMCSVRVSAQFLEALKARRELGLQWEQAAAACWRALPLTLFIPTAGVTSSPRLVRTHIANTHSHTHTHTHIHVQIHRDSCAYKYTLAHRWECEGGPGTTYREQRGKSGKNAASSNKSHHNAEKKNPQPHPQKRKKNLVSLFESSQKCLTKAQIKNILDKRIQAPFLKRTSHQVVCNSYQKLVYLPKNNKI